LVKSYALVMSPPCLAGFGVISFGCRAHLLLQRHADTAASRQIRSVIEQLTRRALTAGTLSPEVTIADVTALTSAMRGLIEATAEAAPDSWQRFLDIQLAGMRSADLR
jgi:hypothetical protein